MITGSTLEVRRRMLGLLLLCGAALSPAVTGCAHGKAAGARDLAAAGDVVFGCDCEATGLVAASPTAGAPSELFVSVGREVLRIEPEGRSTVAWTAPRFSRILRLQAGDLDGDGADEWIVLLDAGGLRSHVVRFEDETWQQSGKPWSGILAMAPAEAGGLRLIAQRSGGATLFGGPVIEVAADESGKLKETAQTGLPSGPMVFDWVWLRAGDATRLFSLEEAGQVAERDLRSPRARQWRSDDRPVGRAVELRREVRDLLGDRREETLRVAPPVVVGDSDGDGVEEMLLVTGGNAPPVVFENLRFRNGGDLRLLEPGPRGLVELRRTPLVGRAMVAAARWSQPDGAPAWAGLVWTRTSGGVGRPQSRVFLFDAATGDLVGAAPGAGRDVSSPRPPAPDPDVVQQPELEPGAVPDDVPPPAAPEAEPSAEPDSAPAPPEQELEE